MARSDLTQTAELLRRVTDGDTGARDELFASLYSQLHELAKQQMANGPRTPTVQPTALVHEMWLRIEGGGPVQLESRRHFLNLAASVMRRVLIDHARRRSAQKRAGNGPREVLDEILVAWEKNDSIDPLALDAALERLRGNDGQLAQIVELRFFGGLTEVETAEVLDLTRRQVQHAWKLARGFLMREIERMEGRTDDG